MPQPQRRFRTDAPGPAPDGSVGAGRLRRAVSGGLVAGAALAMMEIAGVLAQSGAAIASATDLLSLATWLAVPYAIFLGSVAAAAGWAVVAAARVGARGAAPADLWFRSFLAVAGAGVVLIWIRMIAKLGSGGIAPVMALLVALVALAAGVGAAGAIGSAARRAGAAVAPALAAALLIGLAVLVVGSRNRPGPFGKALPAGSIVWRLLLSAIVAAAAAALVVFWIRAAARSRGAGGGATWRWAGRVVAVGALVWVGASGWDFSRMLSDRPARAGAGVPGGAQAVAAAAAPDGARPSIVLISIDTLRADHLSCYGYAKPTSPEIDALARDGILFEKTASTASFTLPAHASMMTGLFPSSHGATYQNRDPGSFTVRGMGSGYPTLAGLLRDAGYETAGFASGPLMSGQFGFSRGFDHYDDRFDRLQTARARLFSRTALFRWMHRAGLFTDRDLDFQRIAPEVNARVVSWLESRAGGRPYFLFVHYWDPHGPYAPPAPLDRRADGSRIEVDYDMDRLLEGAYTLSPSGLADTLELYDREIQYVDGYVGALIDVLRDRGELDNAIVVLTSDHGESFGEHDHWEHSRVLYEDLLHVPFLLRLPGGRAAGTVVRDAIAQPTDILPTVLSAAGLPMPEELEGRDLLAALGDDGSGGREAHPGVRDLQFAFAELDRNVDWPARWGARYDRDLTSVRTLRYKYIQSSTGREELYDLQTDPGETIDQAASMPDSVASMRALVMLWRKSLKERGASDAGGEVDEGLKESLRGLGYIQ